MASGPESPVASDSSPGLSIRGRAAAKSKPSRRCKFHRLAIVPDVGEVAVDKSQRRSRRLPPRKHIPKLVQTPHKHVQERLVMLLLCLGLVCSVAGFAVA